jgi:hypothetical protein
VIDAIVYAIEWVANDLGSAVATIFPFLLAGLVGLYLLSVVLGYLRVSRAAYAPATELAGQAVRLPVAPDGAVEPRRGVPYCPTCKLEYPPGALFCARCEGDLTVECANCGAAVAASDDRCYRCGTDRILADVSH